MLYNISVLSFSGVLLQILGFVYQVLLSRMAGAEGLGLYQLVFPVYSVVMAGSISGVRMAVTSLSAGLHAGDVSGIRSLVRRSVAVFLGLYSLTGIPVLCMHRRIAERIIEEPDAAFALAALIVCLFLSGFEAIFESLFLGIGQTKYTAVSNLLEQGIKIFVILFLLRTWGSVQDPVRTASLIALGMVLCEIPVLIWLCWMYIRLCRKGDGRKTSWKPRVLPAALPVCASSVVTNLIASASVVTLPQRLTLSGMSRSEAISTLGVVSNMALPLLLLPMVLIRAMSNVLLPTISMSAARCNQADIRRKVRKSFQATGLIVLPATALLVPLSPPLARILYRQELSQESVCLLAIVAVISYYEVIASSILNGLGHQGAGMGCMITGELLQFLCTYGFAARPGIGMYGYIWGMIVGPFSVLIISLHLIHRYTGCLPDMGESFLIPLLAAGVAGGFARWCYRSLCTRPLPGELTPIVLSALFGGAVCAGTLYLAGLRPVRYVRTLME